MRELSQYASYQELYRSAQSFVYRAKRTNGESVIVKVLTDVAPTPERLARFKREHMICHELKIPGIIKAFAYAKGVEHYYFELEDIEAQSLDLHLRNGPFSLSQFFHVAHPIVQILGEIHRRDVIHKDINPANIIWNQETNQIRIIDFSIASLLAHESTDHRQHRSLEGTLAYISPEQTRRMNRGIDFRSDLYSLGATFFHLLTGRPPFLADDAIGFVHAHLARTAPTVTNIVPTIPLVISNIIAKLLAKDPEQRYQSASGLLHDLQICRAAWEKSKAIETFALASHDVSSRFQLSDKLYGRVSDRDTIIEGFRRVTEGQHAVCLVHAPSGMGKTRLIREVQRPLVKGLGNFASGKCDLLLREKPYAPLVQALQMLSAQIALNHHHVQEIRSRIRDGAALKPMLRLVPELAQVLGSLETNGHSDNAASDVIGGIAGRLVMCESLTALLKMLCDSEHPLVLVLDDIQWADSGTFDALTHILTQDIPAYVYFIGSYRTQEALNSPSCRDFLTNLNKIPNPPSVLELSPLTEADTIALVSDTLRVSLQQADELGRSCHFKTGGSPFFIVQFLQSLHEKGLIRYDFANGAWTWDALEIRAREVTANVAEFMASKLSDLSPAALAILKYGACLGGEFSLNRIGTVVGHTLRDMHRLLMPALKHGLIQPTSREYLYIDVDETFEQTFAFAHDRIQQAAYDLLSPEQRGTYHAQLAIAIWQHCEHLTELPTTTLFLLTTQINLSSLSALPDTFRKVARDLNLQAALRAKSSAAFQQAGESIAKALSFCGSEWDADAPDVMLALYRAGAAIAYFNSDLATLNRYLAIVEKNEPDLHMRLPIHLAKLSLLSVQQKYAEAADEGFVLLRALGQDLPRHPTQAQIAWQFLRLKWAMRNDKPLHALPENDSEQIRDILHVMTDVMIASVSLSMNLAVYICLLQTRMVLELGSSEYSASPIVSACVVFWKFNDFKSFKRVSALAKELISTDVLPYRAFHVMITYTTFVQPWQESIRDIPGRLDRLYREGLEAGDLEGSSYGRIFSHWFSFYRGDSLHALAERVKPDIAFFKASRNPISAWFLDAFERFVNALQGTTPNHRFLFGSAEADKAKIKEGLGGLTRNGASSILNLKLYILCLTREFKLAWENARQFDEVTMIGYYSTANYYLMSSLVAIGLLREGAGTAKDQRQYRAHFKRCLRRIEIWATQAPDNFAHRAQLLQAEYASFEGDHARAAALYESAIGSVTRSQIASDHAIILEHATRFYLRTNQETVGRHLSQLTYQAYDQWGAGLKTRMLVSEWPWLATRHKVVSGPNTTQTTISLTGDGRDEYLDYGSLLKSYQSLMEIRDLRALIAAILRIINENAGATRCCLFASGRSNEPQLYGSLISDGSAADLLSMTRLADWNDRARGVVQATLNSGRPILINDRQSSDIFDLTEIGCESLFSIPLMRAQTVLGVLYLENRFSAQAFTDRRVETLQTLAGQMLLSLENALLYENLENEVTERTKDLETAQARLIEIAHREGQAEIASNVLHNVGNALTGLIPQVEKISQKADPNFIDPTLADLYDPTNPVKSAVDLRNLVDQVVREKLVTIASSTDVMRTKLSKIYVALDAQREFAHAENLIVATDCDTLIDEALAECEAECKTAMIRLTHVPLATRMKIPTARYKVLACLRMVLRNSIEALADHPGPREIDVQVVYKHPFVEIRIHDNGPGIAPANLNRIFGSGFTTKEGNPGMGLHNAINAIRAFGGDLKVASPGLQRGTTATIRLPAAHR